MCRKRKVYKQGIQNILSHYTLAVYVEARSYTGGHRYLVLVLVPSGMSVKGIRSIFTDTKAARFEEFYPEPPYMSSLWINQMFSL